METYKSVESTLLSWNPKGQACGNLKSLIKTGKGISNTHKVMYISRYDTSVKDWISDTKDTMKHIIDITIPAIKPLLNVLQMLYQGSNEQLIHIDLHVGNIFVKQNPIQFGLTDFGHCLLRRSTDTKEVQAKSFFGKYLCDYICHYDFSIDYSQVPLESRLLNFCFKKNMESATPGNLVKSWVAQVNTIKSGSTDLITMEVDMFIEHLLKKPLFIAFIEVIQRISKKLKINPTNPILLVQSLTQEEQTVIEFILTRYSSISPINTITEAIMMLPTIHPVSIHTRITVHSYFGKKFKEAPTATSKLHYLIDFLIKAIMAPYEQDGSSLSAAFASVQGGDLRIIWDDVLTSV
jgi:hypothetical protein